MILHYFLGEKMPPSIKISSRYWETQIQTIGESRLASIDPQNENSLCLINNHFFVNPGHSSLFLYQIKIKQVSFV